MGRKELRAMMEPSLRKRADKDRTATVNRFLWLPSFHNPISVRFVESDEGVVLLVVRLDGLGGYDEPRRILARKSVKLSPAYWKRITGSLVKAKFWTLPTHKRSPFGRDSQDGDTLIIEEHTRTDIAANCHLAGTHEAGGVWHLRPRENSNA